MQQACNDAHRLTLFYYPLLRDNWNIYSVIILALNDTVVF